MLIESNKYNTPIQNIPDLGKLTKAVDAIGHSRENLAQENTVKKIEELYEKIMKYVHWIEEGFVDPKQIPETIALSNRIQHLRAESLRARLSEREMTLFSINLCAFFGAVMTATLILIPHLSQ